jgi:hypothetical protein
LILSVGKLFRASDFEFVASLLGGPLLFRRVLYGFNDLHVAGAHAQIAGQRFANLFFRWVGITLKKGMARHDHARRAVAALKSVVFNECFLYRAQLTVFRQTFDCCDFTPVRLHGEVEARFDDFAVEQYGASAAFADDAADMSAGKTDILPKKMRQEQAGFNVFLVQSAVNCYGYCLFHYEGE